MGNFRLSAHSTVVRLSEQISYGDKHRVAFDREALFQTGQGLHKKGADQEPPEVSPDVSRIDQTSRHILGARGARTQMAIALEKGGRMEGAFREMVRRWEAEPLRELSRSSSRRTES